VGRLADVASPASGAKVARIGSVAFGPHARAGLAVRAGGVRGCAEDGVAAARITGVRLAGLTVARGLFAGATRDATPVGVP